MVTALACELASASKQKQHTQVYVRYNIISYLTTLTLIQLPYTTQFVPQ
jgi:hypothetical protein